jgi:hypothetical protein
VAEISPSMREQLLKLLSAGQIDDATLRRLDTALRPRKKRGRKKPPWLAHRDTLIDLLVLQEVLKKPAGKASETISRLTGVHPKTKARLGPGREPFKGQGDLLSRHNRLLALLKKNRVFDAAVEAIRTRGHQLYMGGSDGSFSVAGEFAATSGVKLAAFCDRANELNLPERKEFGRTANVMQTITKEFLAKEQCAREEVREAVLEACRGLASADVVALTLQLWDLSWEGHSLAFFGTLPNPELGTN